MEWIPDVVYARSARPWCLRPCTLYPPQAAGAIHGDFERGFICAEIMSFDVLKELGNEMAVKVRM